MHDYKWLAQIVNCWYFGFKWIERIRASEERKIVLSANTKCVKSDGRSKNLILITNWRSQASITVGWGKSKAAKKWIWWKRKTNELINWGDEKWIWWKT